MGKCFGWGILGMFWALSLIPITTTFSYFTYATTYLLMFETALLFLGIIVKVFAFMGDTYLKDHQHLQIWDTRVN